MLIKWAVHQLADPDVFHAIDLHKTDGNPFSLCGKVLLSVGASVTEQSPLAKFGESRESKCKKCFSISRKMLQQQKRRMK